MEGNSGNCKYDFRAWQTPTAEDNTYSLSATGCQGIVKWYEGSSETETANRPIYNTNVYVNGTSTYIAFCHDAIRGTCYDMITISSSGKIGGAGGRLGLPQDTPQNATTGAADCTVSEKVAMKQFIGKYLK